MLRIEQSANARSQLAGAVAADLGLRVIAAFGNFLANSAKTSGQSWSGLDPGVYAVAEMPVPEMFGIRAGTPANVPRTRTDGEWTNARLNSHRLYRRQAERRGNEAGDPGRGTRFVPLRTLRREHDTAFAGRP
jgi:hypothetical protein